MTTALQAAENRLQGLLGIYAGKVKALLGAAATLGCNTCEQDRALNAIKI